MFEGALKKTGVAVSVVALVALGLLLVDWNAKTDLAERALSGFGSKPPVSPIQRRDINSDGNPPPINNPSRGDNGLSIVFKNNPNSPGTERATPPPAPESAATTSANCGSDGKGATRPVQGSHAPQGPAVYSEEQLNQLEMLLGRKISREKIQKGLDFVSKRLQEVFESGVTIPVHLTLEQVVIDSYARYMLAAAEYWALRQNATYDPSRWHEFAASYLNEAGVADRAAFGTAISPVFIEHWATLSANTQPSADNPLFLIN